MQEVLNCMGDHTLGMGTVDSKSRKLHLEYGETSQWESPQKK